MSENEKINELDQTTVPITIRTGFAHRNKQDLRRQQIDKTSYYLSALFWFMKTAVEGYDLLDLQTDTVLYDFNDFRTNVSYLSEIGEALAEQLTLYSCAIPNEKTDDPPSAVQMSDEEEREMNEASERFGENREIASSLDARQLFAALINHPQIPIASQKRIFDFLRRSEVLPAEDIEEVALVTGYEMKRKDAPTKRSEAKKKAA